MELTLAYTDELAGEVKIFDDKQYLLLCCVSFLTIKDEKYFSYYSRVVIASLGSHYLFNKNNRVNRYLSFPVTTFKVLLNVVTLSSMRNILQEKTKANYVLKK